MEKKTWFITGASSGFGEAFVRHAVARGHNVVATARDPQKLEHLVALAPERVVALRLDVTAPGEGAAALDKALSRFGRIDVLVNNAGYSLVGAVEETSEEAMRAMMETNFFGAYALTRAALPVFRRQRGGAIVNMSSIGGVLSFAGFGAYSAAKFALEGMSEALAAEMQEFGVKVLIVEPGAFRTGLAGSAMQYMPEMKEYAASSGATRAFARGMHETQEGDPMKAGPAIEEALAAPDTPLRLQLGQDAVDMVRTHTQVLLADLEKWSGLASSTRIV